MSLKNRLANQLYLELSNVESKGWLNGGALERIMMDCGAKGSTCSRRLREMVNEGELERRQNGKSVEYRFIPKIYAL